MGSPIINQYAAHMRKIWACKYGAHVNFNPKDAHNYMGPKWESICQEQIFLLVILYVPAQIFGIWVPDGVGASLYLSVHIFGIWVPDGINKDEPICFYILALYGVQNTMEQCYPTNNTIGTMDPTREIFRKGNNRRTIEVPHKPHVKCVWA